MLVGLAMPLQVAVTEPPELAVVGGRLLHAVGMLWFETPAPRGVAMLATHGVYLLGGGWLLWHFA